MNTTPQNVFPAACPSADGNIPNNDPLFSLPVDIARKGNCCTMTIKRVADFLNMPVTRTGTGTRIFTRDQARAILAEIEKRRTEALR
ncbi:MAG: hypothetical protein WA117_21295 [Verrucomicrobiia bacterium]